MNIVFLIIDIVVTVYISIVTHHQTSYVPHDLYVCDPGSNPAFFDLQRPAGANESFFMAAARLNGTVTTPKNMCETFVKEWQYGLAIS